MTANEMTDSHILSEDTQAILLLCGVLDPANPSP